jgi:hypothetical protein
VPDISPTIFLVEGRGYLRPKTLRGGETPRYALKGDGE